MTGTAMQELVPVLQTAIGPVILISGIGLLLLSMTNRLGRIIDRSRALLAALDAAGEHAALTIGRELEILWKRARYIRLAIILASMTCLGASLLIILLFLSVLIGLDIPLIISAIFIASMCSVSLSLVLFLLDVNLSLAALKVEQESHASRMG